MIPFSSKQPCYIGIDPGVTGAFAVYWPTLNHVITEVYPGNSRGLYQLLHPYAAKCALAAVEKVGTRPGQNAVSMETFCINIGEWKMLLAVLGISAIRVVPQKWKAKVLDLQRAKISIPKKCDLKQKAKLLRKEKRRQKQAAVDFINSRFPKLNLKKGQHDEAEAVCLALYAYYYACRMRNVPEGPSFENLSGSVLSSDES